MRLNSILCGFVALAALTLPASAQVRRGSLDDESYYDERCDSEAPRERAQCARQALGEVDRQLNVEYQRLMRDAQAVDQRERGRRIQGWYSQEVALRNAQRAWIAMRDADCRFVTQPDLGRRRATYTYGMCLVERTEDRTAQLQAMRRQMREAVASRY